MSSKQARSLRLRGKEVPGRHGAKSEKGRRPEAGVSPSRPPLGLALLPALLLVGLALLPRVRASAWLEGSFWGAAGALLVLQLLLRRAVARDGRQLRYEFVPSKVHYVQAAMQACVYAYWGWYWREVYAHVPLIAAQLAFVYGLDMLVCWWRRDKWVLGFGPFPIIFSTNLFMWFRDDWFFLQFLMVATGVLGKEFIKWNREGRTTHVFNPSALSLALFSFVLIATNGTDITWGPEIAATLGLPPRIYLEIFLVGLVVQVLFSVTLVTLAAAAALCALNLLYTGSTGTYHFLMTNIPISIFLGLHLLVTDPATSPRSTLGKISFGGLYGAAAFGLYGLLGWIGAPTFYDKLLPVPLLNLTVPMLDRASNALAARFRVLEPASLWSPQRLNLGFVGVWVLLFTVLTATDFLGRDHPGRDPEFWRQACEEGRHNGCRTWLTFLDLGCQHDAKSCDTMGGVLHEGNRLARDLLRAGKSFARACDLGLAAGCDHLRALAAADGLDPFRKGCDGGDQTSCFILGELYSNGVGVARDQARALELFERLCASGWARGCGRLAEGYLAGEGIAADPVKAIESFEKACAGGHAQSCTAAATMYRRGIGSPQNESLASLRLRRACNLGIRAACGPGESPTPSNTTPSAVDVLRLGG